MFHDISEFARLETVRRDFVANASHELRTPVTAIRGFAETLLSERRASSEDDRRSYLEMIDRHARRLANLVADLLALSQHREARGRGLTPSSGRRRRPSPRALIRDSGSRFTETGHRRCS